MKVVGLVSGGKDSVYSLLECARHGHEIIAVACLVPEEEGTEELDSFMFQTVGVKKVGPLIAECLGVRLFQAPLRGKSVHKDLEYDVCVEGDEVEDLYNLLKQVQDELPQVQAVSSGAVLSNYQRLRVENVCERLGLQSLAFLWQRDQLDLLKEMVRQGMDAVLVKVASLGLKPNMLGKSIAGLEGTFEQLHEQFGFHACGEGGEYETVTLDCPLFKRRIVLDKTHVQVVEDNDIAPVAHLVIEELHTELKEARVEAQNEQGQEPQVSPPIAPSASTGFVVPLVSKRFVEGCFSQEAPVISRAGKLFYIAGCVAKEEQGLGIEGQVQSALGVLLEKLVEEGLGLSNVCFVQLFVSDMTMFQAVNEVYCAFFKQHITTAFPSRACVQIGMGASHKVVVNAFATTLKRDVLHVKSISKWAPVCIGPYSQANKLENGLCFVAGQIALDPVTMLLSERHKPPSEQFKLALKHCDAILRAKGMSLLNTVRFIVYVSGQVKWNFTDVLASLPDYFEGGRNQLPPTMVVRVPKLPRDAAVEVEAVAIAGEKNHVIEPIRYLGTNTIGIDMRLCMVSVEGKAKGCLLTVHTSTTPDKVFFEKLYVHAAKDVVDSLSKRGFEPGNCIASVFFDSTIPLGCAFACAVAGALGAVSVPVDGLLTEFEERAVLSISCTTVEDMS